MAGLQYLLSHFKWFSGYTYADSIGKGWFGWVIEAKYEGQKVMVQTLREEATQIEKAEFLREKKIWLKKYLFSYGITGCCWSILILTIR